MMGEQTIHVYDEFGQILEVKGICHFSMESTGKKYVFYHLNEEVQGNRIKMYVAECADAQGTAQPIPDDVWLSIRDYMSKLLKRETAEGITGLPMKDSTIYCGKVKKIGVPKESIAVFAATNVIEGAEQKDEPIVDPTTLPVSTPAPTPSEESLDPALNKPEEPKDDSVQLSSTPAVSTVLEPVKDEELYKKVDELTNSVEQLKTAVEEVKATPATADTSAIEELVNKNKEEMITVFDTFKQTILDMKVELDAVRDALNKHLAESGNPTDAPAEKVLVNTEEQQPEQVVEEVPQEPVPEQAPVEPPKPEVKKVVIQTHKEEPQAPKEPEDTLVEPKLTMNNNTTITPVSIDDSEPTEDVSEPEPPALESESNALYEPELVTKEPQYFENAQNLADTEKKEDPLNPPVEDTSIYNAQLPPENPSGEPTPVNNNVVINSINDSSTYVPFDDGASVQPNHFNEAPVQMPTGSVNPKQMAPLGGGATALTPNQLP